MDVRDWLREIEGNLIDRKLGKALKGLENLLLTYPRLYHTDKLAEIMSDYQLLQDYWRKGTKDPQREAIYDQLLRRALVVTTNIGIHYRIRNTTLMSSVYERSRRSRNDWTVSALRQELEDFVSQVAMLDLEQPHMKEAKSRAVYEAHQMLVRDLFDYIWTSRLWNEGMETAFLDMLLSPTIDSMDQQTIISAVMLSAMNAFDPHKVSLLLKVYQQSTDVPLRQRALVGWVLSLDDEKMKLFPEVGRLIAQLLEDEHCQKELTELQLQLIYCANAEGDNRTIQEEIIPEIMKGNHFRVTGHGIEEIEEDPMEDILNPNASEQKMEQLEKAVNRMADMQREGADVYFGGFSQMKRYPFFNDVCNWFLPFYEQQPAVADFFHGNWQGVLRMVMTKNMFCDSDKYSFVLAFDQVVDRLPESMREMMRKNEAVDFMADMELGEQEKREPAFIRRLYLQGLYRFFRLYPSKSLFRNPFDLREGVTPGYLFFCKKAFKNTELGNRCCDVVSFLLKKKRVQDANAVLDNYEEQAWQKFQYQLLKGNCMRLIGADMRAAVRHYKEALSISPDDERAMGGLARSLFAVKDFGGALEQYEGLLALNPDRAGYRLNKAVCLVNLSRYEEALKILFELNYESPDDKGVKRVLAWAMVGAGRYEQAGKLYTELLEVENPVTDDMLNYGFCLWCSGDVASAANMFYHYEELSGHSSSDLEDLLYGEEYELLKQHGITDTEIQLMVDQL